MHEQDLPHPNIKIPQTRSRRQRRHSGVAVTPQADVINGFLGVCRTTAAGLTSRYSKPPATFRYLWRCD
jgi:hypothetical protein